MDIRRFVLVAFAMLVMASACAQKVHLKTVVPARTDLSQHRRIAVLRFEGRGADDVQNQIEVALANARVQGAPYFTVVAREQVDKVLREQKFAVSGAVDERSAARVGKILGVQAIVAGRVNQYAAHDERFTTKSYEGKGKKKREVTHHCVERAAVVDATVKFIDTTSAAVVHTLPIGGTISESACEGSPPDSSLLLLAASRQMAAEFARDVAPHETTVKLELRRADDDGGMMGGGSADSVQATQLIERGVVYATNGNWQLAMQAWESAAQVKPTCAAAYYNLGVASEQTGNLQEAARMYDKAATMRADPLYIQASVTIRQRIAADESVRRQLGSASPSGRGPP